MRVAFAIDSTMTNARAMLTTFQKIDTTRWRHVSRLQDRQV
jgi:hypothetical protein